MSIRHAIPEDCEAIRDILTQLDYPDTESFLLDKMKRIINQPNSLLVVYQLDQGVVAFIAIDFIAQLALRGDFARISYFAVDAAARNKRIGQQLESYCEELARQRNCDRIEVHCHERRAGALRFYKRQGYIESPKYLIKSLR